MVRNACCDGDDVFHRGFLLGLVHGFSCAWLRRSTMDSDNGNNDEQLDQRKTFFIFEQLEVFLCIVLGVFPHISRTL